MAEGRRGGSHAGHNLELVAAASAGDATGSDQVRAADLLASCAECAALAADLRSIAAGTRTLGSAFAIPVARAPRDFRLSEQDAARLGRRGILGIGRTRASLTWTRRLGGSLATLGLVGLLVSAAPLGLPRTAGGAPAGERDDQGVSDPYGLQEAAPAPSSLTSKVSEAPNLSPAEQSAEMAAEPVVSSENGLLAIVAGGVLVAGVSLLLASRNGRRAGP